jgi:rSAM/selenodomain-associated transferase 1
MALRMRVFGIFAKHPIPGAVKTRLAVDVGPVVAAELSEAFLRDLTERFAHTADRRWLGYTPGTPETRGWFERFAKGNYQLWEQPAGDLGRRMEEYFADVFIAGASRAVLIGSDSPTLPVELVEQAFTQLESHDAVLGPAQDGGYYLIGLRQVWHGLLHGVRWSTPHAFADTNLRFRCAEFSTAVLPSWNDVDTADDLNTLAEQFTALRSANPSRPVSATESWIQQHLGDAAAIP